MHGKASELSRKGINERCEMLACISGTVIRLVITMH
jgi:hypothetical protein